MQELEQRQLVDERRRVAAPDVLNDTAERSGAVPHWRRRLPEAHDERLRERAAPRGVGRSRLLVCLHERIVPEGVQVALEPG
jgi:hypothetical protein